jgi:hypothetical protein
MHGACYVTCYVTCELCHLQLPSAVTGLWLARLILSHDVVDYPSVTELLLPLLWLSLL